MYFKKVSFRRASLRLAEEEEMYQKEIKELKNYTIFCIFKL